MMGLPFSELSARYQVRRIAEEDLPELLELAAGNPTYYEHMHERPALETLREDLTRLPPRTAPEDKYFLGFYREGRLCAALDLILRYPEEGTAFVGWFILRKDLQGRGTGTEIVRELMEFLKKQGFSSLRLAYVKGNPESRAFWEKNGLAPTGAESRTEKYAMVAMGRQL